MGCPLSKTVYCKEAMAVSSTLFNASLRMPSLSPSKPIFLIKGSYQREFLCQHFGATPVRKISRLYTSVSSYGLVGQPLFLGRTEKAKGKKVTCELAAGASIPNASGMSWNQDLHSLDSGPTFGQKFRAFCFYTVTCLVAIPLFVVMLLVHPFVLVLDKHKRKAHHLVNKIWASLTVSLFYPTQIEGLENLPGPDEPVVYVSNHQSFLDIYTLFLLNRPFKYISKTSIFLIPIIGWAMYLTGHIPLRRDDTRSQIECLKRCVNLVKMGVPVFFFPEGTRSTDGKMAQFKKGAFSVAMKAKVPVVPISLIGTGKLMPNGLEGTLSTGSVKVIIHPPITGTSAEELCELSRAKIADSLLKHGLEVE